eukprot:gene12642-6546_t
MEIKKCYFENIKPFLIKLRDGDYNHCSKDEIEEKEECFENILYDHVELINDARDRLLCLSGRINKILEICFLEDDKIIDIDKKNKIYGEYFWIRDYINDLIMRDYIVDTFYKSKNKYVDQDIISELLNKYMKGEKYLWGEKKLKFFTYNNYELIYSVLELLIDKKKGPIGTYSFRCGDLGETFLNMRHSIHFTHPTIEKKC